MSDIPIVWERRDLKYLVIAGSSKVRIKHYAYYVLKDGRFDLKDGKNIFGDRYMEVKRRDIICIRVDEQTGHEDFCGWLNELGETIKSDYSTCKIPNSLRGLVRMKSDIIKSEYAHHPLLD